MIMNKVQIRKFKQLNQKMIIKTTVKLNKDRIHHKETYLTLILYAKIDLKLPSNDKITKYHYLPLKYIDIYVNS